MGRYRKMLVAIDGSKESLHALRESFKLASKEKSWITAVCVTPPYVGDLETVAVSGIKEAVEKPCVEALAAAAEVAKEEHLFLKTVHAQGEFHEMILDVASEYNCELIVMGKSTKRRLERTLIGSVTARVIGYSPCDVLVVPPMAEIGWQRILVATDGSKYSANAVDRAIDFALSYGGALTVLSVVDVPVEFYGEAPGIVDNLIEKSRSIVDAAVAKAKAAGLSAEGIVKQGNAHEIILEVAGSVKANTIAMASHGKTGIRRLLMGSVTEQVVGFSPCPVLITKG